MSADALELEVFEMRRSQDEDEEEDEDADAEEGALRRNRRRVKRVRARGKASANESGNERSRSVRAKRSPYLAPSERRERSLPDVRPANINISVNLGCRGSDDGPPGESSESLPTRQPGSRQRKHHGLRNSLLTVIGKLVVWNDNRRHYRRGESVTGPGPSESASSQYFKSFIVTGRCYHNVINRLVCLFVRS